MNSLFTGPNIYDVALLHSKFPGNLYFQLSFTEFRDVFIKITQLKITDINQNITKSSLYFIFNKKKKHTDFFYSKSSIPWTLNINEFSFVESLSHDEIYNGGLTVCLKSHYSLRPADVVQQYCCYIKEHQDKEEFQINLDFSGEYLYPCSFTISMSNLPTLRLLSNSTFSFNGTDTYIINHVTGKKNQVVNRNLFFEPKVINNELTLPLLYPLSLFIKIPQLKVTFHDKKELLCLCIRSTISDKQFGPVMTDKLECWEHVWSNIDLEFDPINKLYLFSKEHLIIELLNKRTFTVYSIIYVNIHTLLSGPLNYQFSVQEGHEQVKIEFSIQSHTERTLCCEFKNISLNCKMDLPITLNLGFQSQSQQVTFNDNNKYSLNPIIVKYKTIDAIILQSNFFFEFCNTKKTVRYMSNLPLANILPFIPEKHLTLPLTNSKLENMGNFQCDLLVHTNTDHIGLYNEYLQQNSGLYRDNQISYPSSYVLQNGFSELQPSIAKISRTSAQEVIGHYKKSLLSNIPNKGFLKIIQSNINLPDEVYFEIKPDHVVISYDGEMIRQLTFDYMNVTSKNYLINIITPNIQIEASSLEASNFKRQLDYLIRVNSGRTDFEINNESTEVNIEGKSCIPPPLDKYSKVNPIDVSSHSLLTENSDFRIVFEILDLDEEEKREPYIKIMNAEASMLYQIYIPDPPDDNLTINMPQNSQSINSPPSPNSDQNEPNQSRNPYPPSPNRPNEIPETSSRLLRPSSILNNDNLSPQRRTTIDTSNFDDHGNSNQRSPSNIPNNNSNNSSTSLLNNSTTNSIANINMNSCKMSNSNTNINSSVKLNLSSSEVNLNINSHSNNSNSNSIINATKTPSPNHNNSYRSTPNLLSNNSITNLSCKSISHEEFNTIPNIEDRLIVSKLAFFICSCNQFLKLNCSLCKKFLGDLTPYICYSFGCDQCNKLKNVLIKSGEQVSEVTCKCKNIKLDSRTENIFKCRNCNQLNVLQCKCGSKITNYTLHYNILCSCGKSIIINNGSSCKHCAKIYTNLTVE